VGEPHRHPLRVRYHECDPQGVVFNANYLAYADMAITELFREAFGSWQAPMSEHGLDMVVAEANVRYRAPLRFDEEVQLVSSIERIGETSLVCSIAIERNGEAAAEVTIRHVFVDEATRAKAPIPAAMRERLAAYLSSAQTVA
jgi:acyl-CoA thioester hydrolase